MSLELSRCRTMETRGLLARWVLVLAAGVVAVGEPQTPRLDTVYVAVADARGDPVGGLTASDFVVVAEGSESKVIGVRRAVGPLALAVVVDTELEDLPAVRRSLSVLFDRLRAARPESRAGVVFLRSPAVTLVRVGDTASTGRMLKDLVGGGHALLPGIIEATRVLKSERPGPRVVFAIARVQHPEGLTAERVATALQDASVALWGVVIGRSGSGLTATEEVMSSVTRQTGGRGEWTRDSLSLEGITTRLVTLILSSYEVAFLAPPESSRGYGIRVGVRREGVEVYAPGSVPADRFP